MEDFNLQEHFYKKRVDNFVLLEKTEDYSDDILCNVSDRARKVLGKYSPEELDENYEEILYYLVDAVDDGGAVVSKQGVDFEKGLKVVKSLYNNIRHYDPDVRSENCEYGRLVIAQLT